jgi:hypothetical protein
VNHSNYSSALDRLAATKTRGISDVNGRTLARPSREDDRVQLGMNRMTVVVPAHQSRLLLVRPCSSWTFTVEAAGTTRRGAVVPSRQYAMVLVDNHAADLASGAVSSCRYSLSDVQEVVMPRGTHDALPFGRPSVLR